jgi:hypothetical protein
MSSEDKTKDPEGVDESDQHLSQRATHYVLVPNEYGFSIRILSDDPEKRYWPVARSFLERVSDRLKLAWYLRGTDLILSPLSRLSPKGPPRIDTEEMPANTPVPRVKT